MDYTVHGILQARIQEWVAFPFSKGIFPTQAQMLKNSCPVWGSNPQCWDQESHALPAELAGRVCNPEDKRYRISVYR